MLTGITVEKYGEVMKKEGFEDGRAAGLEQGRSEGIAQGEASGGPTLPCILALIILSRPARNPPTKGASTIYATINIIILTIILHLLSHILQILQERLRL